MDDTGRPDDSSADQAVSDTEHLQEAQHQSNGHRISEGHHMHDTSPDFDGAAATDSRLHQAEDRTGLDESAADAWRTSVMHGDIMATGSSGTSAVRDDTVQYDQHASAFVASHSAAAEYQDVDHRESSYDPNGDFMTAHSALPHDGDYHAEWLAPVHADAASSRSVVDDHDLLARLRAARETMDALAFNLHKPPVTSTGLATFDAGRTAAMSTSADYSAAPSSHAYDHGGYGLKSAVASPARAQPYHAGPRSISAVPMPYPSSAAAVLNGGGLSSQENHELRAQVTVVEALRWHES